VLQAARVRFIFLIFLVLCVWSCRVGHAIRKAVRELEENQSRRRNFAQQGGHSLASLQSNALMLNGQMPSAQFGQSNLLAMQQDVMYSLPLLAGTQRLDAFSQAPGVGFSSINQSLLLGGGNGNHQSFLNGNGNQFLNFNGEVANGIDLAKALQFVQGTRQRAGIANQNQEGLAYGKIHPSRLQSNLMATNISPLEASNPVHSPYVRPMGGLAFENALKWSMRDPYGGGEGLSNRVSKSKEEISRIIAMQEMKKVEE
jgi:hypothetical protein